MFTGIIEGTGRVQAMRLGSRGAALAIASPAVAPSLGVGDSVAVNGVCVTVVKGGGDSFGCDLSPETISRTSLAYIREGMVVNLERPIMLNSRLGGHFVQGHVDGVGKLAGITPSGEGSLIRFEYPGDLGRYLVLKGSIAVDGISLTIATLENTYFTAAVIPHTLKATNLRFLRVGDAVNLEVDILGKYVERFLQLGLLQQRGSKLTLEYFKEQGF